MPIPGGAFRMGSEDGRPDEQPVHVAEIAAVSMGTTPVTVEQYSHFLAGWRMEPPPWWTDPDFGVPDQPVVGVSWFEAALFADWLSQETGGRWRLPSEAEWERAARGGIEGGRTVWGDAVPAGEIPEGPLNAPWPVGRGTPNPYGLLDMGTIVHEWCSDRYRPYGATGDGQLAEERRVSRGGSWRHKQRWSSPSARSSLPPSSRYSDYGFRVVSVPVPRT